MQLISKTNIKIIYSLHSHDKIEKKKINHSYFIQLYFILFISSRQVNVGIIESRKTSATRTLAF